MLACKAGSPACVRALLAAGADPTLFDSLSHSTCLHYAARWVCCVLLLSGVGRPLLLLLGSRAHAALCCTVRCAGPAPAVVLHGAGQ